MIEDRIFIKCQATDNHTIENICLDYKIKREELKKQYGFNKYNFIYVGRLSPEKNLITLLKAFDNIIKNEKESKDWGLIIVGDGPQRKELEEFVEKYNLKNYVFFVGGKSWKEVVEYYTLADVFILPSLSEPWGLVVNEAMICGLPVIVSKSAGSYWDLLKEGINGFGFDPLNQKELENIMLKFISGEVNMKKMGEASKEIIKEYTPENAARQMLKGIEKVLELKK
ncbi:glycosyltransferase family 4 protein [Caldisericum sp.]|uniref:glycosyltransferase family 4 protein n=1 Tax=Caldisericum sp. TaxID=2499687 RepID=UPI003D1279D6